MEKDLQSSTTGRTVQNCSTRNFAGSTKRAFIRRITFCCVTFYQTFRKNRNIQRSKWFAGSRNAVKLAASGGTPAAAIAASAHPPVLWSSRRKPGKSSTFLTFAPGDSRNVVSFRRQTACYNTWKEWEVHEKALQINFKNILHAIRIGNTFAERCKNCVGYKSEKKCCRAFKIHRRRLCRPFDLSVVKAVYRDMIECSVSMNFEWADKISFHTSLRQNLRTFGRGVTLRARVTIWRRLEVKSRK